MRIHIFGVNMEAISVFEPKLRSQLSLPSQTNMYLVNNLSRFPLTSFAGKHVKLVPLKATSTITCDDQESNRVFKKLSPSNWGHHFLSVHVDVTEVNALWKEIETLKPKVQEMFMSSNDIESAKHRIVLIYLLVSLGLGYHFEDEIEETLKEGLEKIDEMMAGEDDLYTISIIFWVFRTYGHNMSSDVFKRFKDSNGKFKESLIEDIMGMLSLYEAAHLMTTTDYIVDEALSFASNHLESLAVSQMCPLHITKRIRNALSISQNKNMKILVAMEYIRFYEQEDDYDEMLLKFSKLNFRLLQLHYLQELKILTKWYKDQDFASKLPPYYRDRIVEMHFISLSYFEPKFSRARIMLTKLFTVQIFIDDTCDRYASLCEVESLANAIDRWDPEDAMDRLPMYLKFVFKFVLNTFKEFEREVGSELGGFNSVEATIEECKKFMSSDLEFARWAETSHVPSFEEYLEVGGVEMATYLTLAGAFMGMEQTRTKEAYDWLKSRTKLVRLIGAKARILNDTTGFESDMRRGVVTNAVTYYMKQYGVTEEESFKRLYQLVANIDKVMNEEFLKTDKVPRQLMNAVINCARMVNVSYNIDDGFTNPDGNFKDYITSLYFD